MIIRKVTAFITRETPDSRQLLVFQHPNAGVQLPAGTVDEGESSDVAVIREACEETGLCDLTLIGLLGELPRQTGANQFRLTRSVNLRSAPQTDAPLTGHRLSYGWLVDFVRRDETTGAVQIRYPEMKYLGGERWEVEFELVGWTEPDALTDQESRLAYHLSSTTPTADTWEHIGDHDHTFRCYWVDVHDDSPLIPLHAGWFEIVKDQLRRR